MFCYSIFYSQYVFICIIFCTMISLFSIACTVLILSCTFPFKAPFGSVLTPLGSVLKLSSVEFESWVSQIISLPAAKKDLLSTSVSKPVFPIACLALDLIWPHSEPIQGAKQAKNLLVYTHTPTSHPLVYFSPNLTSWISLACRQAACSAGIREISRLIGLEVEEEESCITGKWITFILALLSVQCFYLRTVENPFLGEHDKWESKQPLWWRRTCNLSLKAHKYVQDCMRVTMDRKCGRAGYVVRGSSVFLF